MTNPHWNEIMFDRWVKGEAEITVNNFSKNAVVLETTDPDDNSMWMTPDEARELAGKLIEAAEAVDAAGLFKGNEERT